MSASYYFSIDISKFSIKVNNKVIFTPAINTGFS